MSARTHPPPLMFGRDQHEEYTQTKAAKLTIWFCRRRRGRGRRDCHWHATPESARSWATWVAATTRIAGKSATKSTWGWSTRETSRCTTKPGRRRTTRITCWASARHGSKASSRASRARSTREVPRVASLRGRASPHLHALHVRHHSLVLLHLLHIKSHQIHRSTQTRAAGVGAVVLSSSEPQQYRYMQTTGNYHTWSQQQQLIEGMSIQTHFSKAERARARKGLALPHVWNAGDLSPPASPFRACCCHKNTNR